MTTTPFRRVRREAPPEMPSGELSLQEPPSLPELQHKDPFMMFMMVPTLVISGVMMLMIVSARSVLLAVSIFFAMLAMAAIMVLVQMLRSGNERRHTVKADRRDYMRYLGQIRGTARGAAARQRESVLWRHPHPDGLWNLAMSPRLWERRAAHGDFGEVRIGIGPHDLSLTMTPLSTKPIDDLEPLSARALRKFIAVHGVVPDLPISLMLRAFRSARLIGDVEVSRAMMRAILAQLVTLHGPDELRVAICASAAHVSDWDWTKWLPHAQSPARSDATGPSRLFDSDVEAFQERVLDEVDARPRFEADATPSAEEPFVVIILDTVVPDVTSRLASAGYRNAIVFELGFETDHQRSVPGLLIDVSEDEAAMLRKDRVGDLQRTFLARPDQLDVTRATALARTMSPMRVGGGNAIESNEPMVGDFELPGLLGISDIETWHPRATAKAELTANRLRVPLGVDDRGRPIELDLKEAAQGGMGPHGLLIGATGSGKSELLRTMVMGLAMTNSSEMLNFVLVDFKGGATFLGLDELPHVSALITNLADEATLVTRMQDAISGEMTRRQEYLRAAGNYSSLLEHEKARLSGAALEPMPSLFIIVDEFSELLASNPDFAELFVMIGRLGRSLGVHLLLASQRLDDGRIAKIEGHLSYRIGLRTFSAMESRSVIGVPDAYELPNAPGNGYLRSDVATLTRFKAAYVSGAYERRTDEQRREIARQQVVRFDLTEAARPAEQAAPSETREATASNEPEAAPGKRSTVMDVLTERMTGYGRPAHQVWLPPLDAPPTLDQLLPPLVPDPVRGLQAIGWNGSGNLTVPIGIIDRPYEQTRELYEIDLSSGGGNVGVAGGAQSGKSTLLRTIVCGLALTHTPRQVQFYCLDFGGGALAALESLPHVGSVATRMQPERVSRTIAETTTLLAAREKLFSEHGVESMADYRRRALAGEFPDEQFGDLFVVVDGWGSLRAEFEELEATLRAIARQGLTYGVHLLVSTSRWTDVHSSLRDQLGTRIELKLGDSIDSLHGMRKAAAVPQIPGRGITEDGAHYLAGIPRIDGVNDVDGIAAAVRALGADVSDAWQGAKAPPVRLLPSVVPAAVLPDPEPGPTIALGLSEEDLQPVMFDFASRPHLSVVGDSASGKTAVLRLVASQVPKVWAASEVRVVLIDPRRGLVESVPEEYVEGTAFSGPAATELVARIAAELSKRVPGADITPAQLRRRDWWSGPEYFVCADDFDLLGSGALAPLVELIPQAADIGLHLVIARAGAGASRTAMDNVIRRLHESNAPELTLSMPASEILTFGGRGRPLPPGRGALLTRRGGLGIQVGWSEPTE